MKLDHLSSRRPTRLLLVQSWISMKVYDKIIQGFSCDIFFLQTELIFTENMIKFLMQTHWMWLQGTVDHQWSKSRERINDQWWNQHFQRRSRARKEREMLTTSNNTREENDQARYLQLNTERRKKNYPSKRKLHKQLTMYKWTAPFICSFS